MKRSRLVASVITVMVMLSLAFTMPGLSAYADDDAMEGAVAQAVADEGDAAGAQEDASAEESLVEASNAPVAPLDESAPGDASALTSASEEGSLAPAEDGTQQEATRTIMLYLCGSNLETYSGMATYNLKQIPGSSFSANE